MWKLLRRLFWLAALSGAGYAGYTTWQRRQEPEPAGPPSWPPFEPQTEDEPAGDPLVAAFTHLGDTTRAADSDAGSVAGSDAGRSDDTAGDTADTAGDTATDRRWVEPVDGECPPGFPIKGNDNSGIFHVPGGRFYDRTVPERCYANEDDALADGYRRAKA